MKNFNDNSNINESVDLKSNKNLIQNLDLRL